MLRPEQPALRRFDAMYLSVVEKFQTMLQGGLPVPNPASFTNFFYVHRARRFVKDLSNRFLKVRFCQLNHWLKEGL